MDTIRVTVHGDNQSYSTWIQSEVQYMGTIRGTVDVQSWVESEAANKLFFASFTFYFQQTIILAFLVACDYL